MRTGLLLLLATTAQSPALDVLVLDDEDDEVEDFEDLLDSWGHTVTLSTDAYGVWSDGFDDDSGITLSDYDAVVWLDGANAVYYEMSEEGLRLLYSYVEEGGGLLLFGSTGYQYSIGYYEGFGSLIPLRSSDYTTSKDWVCEDGDHPLAEGYDDGDEFEPDSGLIRDSSASTGDVPFTYERYSTDYDAAAAVELSNGRLVQYALWGNTTSSFSSYETNWGDDNVGQLVENALQWITLRPPEITLADGYTVAAESSLRLSITAVDPDGGPVSYAWDVGADGSTDGTGTTHAFSASGYDGPDTESFSVVVTDDEGESASTTGTITITNVDPLIVSTPSTSAVSEGTEVEYAVDYTDVESADTHTVSWDFGDDRTGSGSSASNTWTDDSFFTITVTVTDDDGGSDTASFVQNVTNVAPTLSGDPDTTATTGALYSFTPTVTDPGTDDTFTFTGSLPDGASIDSDSGTVTWTPDDDQIGEFSFGITVQDDDGGSDTLRWGVEVTFQDSDGDGMPDSWEEEHGLDPDDASDAAEDGDGDGRTNLDEYEGGSDPNAYEGPGQPTLSSPDDGEEVAEQPELQVDNADAPLGQALTYAFQLYSDEALSALAASVDGRFEGSDGNTEWVVSGIVLVENADYWWTATASDAFVTSEAPTARSFFVNFVNEAPGAPGIYSPFDGGIVEALTPDMVLTAGIDPDRDDLTYTATVTVADSGDVVTVVDGLVDDGSQASWTLSEDLTDETEYCWSATSADPDGLVSEVSEVACFFVDLENDAPSAPTIISPDDGAVLATTQPLITVEDGVDPEGRATIHEFQVDVVETFDSESLQSGAIDTDSDGTSEWSPELALAENTTWYVRARCNDGGAASEWDSASFFISLENLVPDAPVLVSPTDGSEIGGGSATFTIDNATDPEGDTVSYDFVVLDRVGSTVIGAENVSEGESGTAWSPSAMEDGVYTWTARAVDSNGGESEWASPWVFAVVDGVVTGDGGDDTGDGLDVKGSGCSCATGTSAPGATGMALFGGMLGLVGLRRRRRG